MPDVRLALMVMRQAISNPASPGRGPRGGCFREGARPGRSGERPVMTGAPTAA